MLPPTLGPGLSLGSGCWVSVGLVLLLPGGGSGASSVASTIASDVPAASAILALFFLFAVVLPALFADLPAYR